MIQHWLQRLARLLDNPAIPWKRLVIGFSVGEYVLESYLLFRQYGMYKKTTKPKALEHEVGEETFEKSQAYGRAKAKFSAVSSAFNIVKNIAEINFNLYPKVWALTGLWLARYAPARFSGEITHSLLFMFTFDLYSSLTSIPFDLYSTFVLEEKFGFNKMNMKLWIKDLIKSKILGVAFGVPIGSAFLWIVQKTGNNFFYYLWLFMLVVQLTAVTVFPIWITPLFNKLTPLKPGPLKEGVEALAEKLKFPLTELQVIDGSTRSSHSNAYFTGLPWKKKIVIYDTLLDHSTDKEVEAVLAHELGHWKMGHTTRLLMIGQAHLFYIFALFSAFIGNKSLYADFGFHNERPILIGLLLFMEALSPTDALIKLGLNMMTRSMEYQADDFAKRLGYTSELASALIRLQISNLSSMDADWMYSSFHYSHPILTERLKAIEWKGRNKEEVEAAALAAKEAKASRTTQDEAAEQSEKKEL